MTKALILIDIQNDYFENGSNTLDGAHLAAKNARLILDEFRSKGLPIIHIQHLATRPTATFFIPGTKGADINDEVKPFDDEKLVVKHFPNSFRETDLLEYLRTIDASHLVICGMMTHMCVDATIRAAKDLGFECTVIGDACATKDLEIGDCLVESTAVQASFLAALNYFYAEVMTTEAYLSHR